ncbi:MAG: CHAD domain-containing protein, partial [Actinomycetota bacterium]|nr:CHAD domain-containing protein [Actinomycetota bacterium]
MELAELFRRELSRAARRLLEADARLARGPGPSAVHDARVALTRARALLRTFRSLLEPAALRCARPELAWVDALLAPVRDLDVVAARLLEHAAPGPGGRPRPLDAALTAALAADRAAELSCLGSARSSGRYTLALSLVDAWGDDPP